MAAGFWARYGSDWLSPELSVGRNATWESGISVGRPVGAHLFARGIFESKLCSAKGGLMEMKGGSAQQYRISSALHTEEEFLDQVRFLH